MGRVPVALLAVLLVVAGSASALGSHDGESDGWLDLDRELGGMEALLRDQTSHPKVGVTMKYRYLWSDNLVYTLDPKTFQDQGGLSGFEFQTLSLRVKGKVGDYSYKVSYNPARDRLRSAFLRFRPNSWSRVTIGRYKAPLLRSRIVSTTKLLFAERTLQARATGPRELGAKYEVFLGDRWTWIGSYQNAKDGTGNRHRLIARLEWRALGGGARSQEGALGAGARPRLTLGAGYADENSVKDGEVLAADAAFTLGRFSLSGELLKNGNDLGDYRKGLVDPVSILRRGGTSPWDASVGWVLLPEALEAGSRLEVLRDDNHTERLSLGLNWYRDGHKSKWVLTWSKVSSDNDLLESTLLSVGYVVSI